MIVSRIVNFGVKCLKDIEYFFLKMFQLPANTGTHSAERRKFILG